MVFYSLLTIHLFCHILLDIQRKEVRTNMETGKKLEDSLKNELVDGQATQNQGGDQGTISNNQGQSSASQTDAQMYTLPGHVDGSGNPIKMTAEQVTEKYKELNSSYTQKSQELSQLKNNQPQSQSQPQSDQGRNYQKPNQPEIDPRTNQPLSAKDQALQSELKRLGVAFADQVPDENKIIERASSVSLNNITLRNALDELSTEFNGREEEVGNVKVKRPQVDQEKVLEFIRANPNTDRTPREIARYLYADDFINYEAQKRVVGSNTADNNVPSTEGQGAGNTGNQPGPAPYRFGDGSAERGVRDILQNG